MSSAPAPPSRSGLPSSVALAFVPLIVAAAATHFAARWDGTGFQEVILLPPGGLDPARFVLALLAIAAGYFGVYFAPGMLVMRALRLRVPTSVGGAAAAFVLSLAALSAAWIVAMGVTDGAAGRSCVYLTVAAVDAAALLAGVLLASRAPKRPERPDRAAARAEVLVPAAGVLLVVAAAWMLMPGKITEEALEGDATEVHGFATSLAEGGLPEWDLENGAWGFYPTFMYVGYPVYFSLALAGDSEAAVRLPALLFLGVLLVMTADLAGRGRFPLAGARLTVLLPVLVVGYLSVQVGANFAGYHPVHGDLACSPLEEWMVTGFALAALVLLRDGAPGIAAVAALLSILTFPSGTMFVGLLGIAGLATGGPSERRVVLRWGFLLAGMLAAYAVALWAYTSAQGTFAPMMDEWIEKYFSRRAGLFSDTPQRILAAAGWYTLLAGGLPVLAYFLVWRGDRVTRWLAGIGAAWTVFFLLSPGKNVHYFFPTAMIPVAIALRHFAAPAADPRRGRLVAGALVLSGVVCIALCRPSEVFTYTADREFGRRTLFLAGSYHQAVEYSRILYNLAPPLNRYDPEREWTIGPHTWVMYADRAAEPQREYDFYVGEGPPPREGLVEITRMPLDGERVVKLWSPGGRAAFRAWKDRTFIPRRELTPFNFEMPPAPGPAREAPARDAARGS